MESKYTLETTVPLSVCDTTGCLGWPGAFRWFMDLAAEAAERGGFGASLLRERGLFWITVRTRIRMYHPAPLLTPIRVDTWPGKPRKTRCDRDYTIRSAEGELLWAGKTEWTVLEPKTGKIHLIENIYPDELREHLTEDTVWDEPFAYIDEDFTSGEELGMCVVRSSDLDFEGHMNNAAYPRALFGMFSAQELRERPFHDAELCFRAPAYEGQTLRVLARREDAGTDAGFFNEEGRIVLLARLRH